MRAQSISIALSEKLSISLAKCVIAACSRLPRVTRLRASLACSGQGPGYTIGIDPAVSGRIHEKATPVEE